MYPTISHPALPSGPQWAYRDSGIRSLRKERRWVGAQNVWILITLFLIPVVALSWRIFVAEWLFASWFIFISIALLIFFLLLIFLVLIIAYALASFPPLESGARDPVGVAADLHQGVPLLKDPQALVLGEAGLLDALLDGHLAPTQPGYGT